MSLQSIPSDILLGIIQHVSSWTTQEQPDFIQQLSLLGVFQRLRTLALPKIYSHVYIDFNEDDEWEGQGYINKYSEAFAKYINSNADIIALANCTHMVKSAILYSYNHDETYDVLCNSFEALKTCANLWPNVTKLTISMDHNCDDIPGESHLMQFRRLSTACCQVLVNIMPGVTELKLANYRGRQNLNVFFSQVTDAYASQLVKLSNECEFDCAVRNKLEVLQHLFICISYRNIVLPRVNSHILVSLNIERITIIDFWTSFMDNENDTTIEFSCLKKLSLEFSLYRYIDVDMPKIVLKFPKLRSLTIVCYTDISSFFKASSFSNTMEYIYIKAPPELIAWLKRVGMPTAKKVTIVPYS